LRTLLLQRLLTRVRVQMVGVWVVAWPAWELR
jgi:hypothetical protein